MDTDSYFYAFGVTVYHAAKKCKFPSKEYTFLGVCFHSGFAQGCQDPDKVSCVLRPGMEIDNYC